MADKTYTLAELVILLGKANSLKEDIAEKRSLLGHKKHNISENEKAINRAEVLKSDNMRLVGEIDAMNKYISEEEAKLNVYWKTLNDNGVPVADRLKGTTIVNVG